MASRIKKGRRQTGQRGAPKRRAPTVRSATENALRLSGERYRTFVAQSSEGIWRVEFDEPIPTDLPEQEQVDLVYARGYFAECNDAMARMYGFPDANGLAGARVKDLLPRDDPHNVQYLLTALRNGYRIADAESHELDVNGNLKYFLNNFVGIVEDGKLVRAWGTQRDITDIKRAGQSLRESEERYKSLIRHSPLGILAADTDGRILLLNKALLEILGSPSEETTKEINLLSFPPLVESGAAALFLRCMETGEPVQAEIPYRSKWGKQIVTHVYVTPIRGPAGETAGFQAIVDDITERIRTGAALNESELKFRTLVERSLAGIYIIQDDRFVYANPKLAEIFGVTPGAIQGKDVYDLVAPEDRDLVRESMRRRVDRGEESVHYQYTGIRADGARIRVEVLGSKMDLGGRPALIGTLMDVTDRQRAEEALRDSKHFTENLVESLPVGVSVIDLDGTRVTANRTFCEMTGYARDELVGKRPPFAIWPPEHAREIQTVFADMRTGRMEATELTFMRKNGERFPALVSPSYLRDEQGRITSIVVSFLDLTGRKRADEALRQSEERYRALAESSQDFLFIIGRDGRVQYVNATAAAEFDARPEEIVGRTIAGLFQSDNSGRMEGKIRQVFETGGPLCSENNTRFPRRTIWLDTWLVPLKDEVGEVTAVFGISRDFTRRKIAEDELLKTTSDLRAIFTALPDLYFRMDADGTILDHKAGRAEDLYLPPEEFLGKRMQDVLPPDVARLFADALPRVGVSDDLVTLEYALPLPQGEQVFEARCVPVPDGHVAVFIRNITEEKRAEEVLIDKERYQALFERSLDCVYLHDFAGKILDANNAMLSTLGYSEKEFLGLEFTGLLDPEGAEAARRTFAEIEQTGSHRGFTEYRLKRKDGTSVYFEAKASAVYRDGKAWAIQGVARNVTQRRRAEAARRESELRYRELYEKFKNIVESSPDAIVVTDLEGTLVDCNQPAVEMNGAPSKKEFVGRNLWQFIEPDNVPKAAGSIQALLSGASVRNLELTFLRADGSPFPAEISASMIRDARDEPALFLGIIKDITERKSAEAAVRESEEKFRALTENSYDTIMRFDRECRHLYANPVVEPQTGIPAWRFIGKTHRELGFPEPLCALWEAAIGKVFETKEPNRIEFELPTHIWIDWLLIPEFTPQGEVASVITSARDITGRKNAEAAIRQNEERYRELYQKYLNILDSSPDAITLADMEGRIIDCNRQTLLMHGVKSKEELVGANSFEFIVERDRPRVLEGMRRAVDEGAVKNVEYTLFRRDRSEFPAEISASIVRDAAGNPVAFIGIVTDITDRKRAEEALRESEEKFRGLFESSRDAIMTLEPPSWRFTSGNPATVAMFRAKDADEFISYEPWRLSPERQQDGRPSADKAIDMIETAMQKGSHFFEWSHKRIDGEEFPASVLLTRVEQAGKQFLQATVRDLTEHKRLEQQAIQTEKMAAVGTLVAGLSHELNNPIGVILGYAQSLLKHSAAGSPLKPAITSIEREAQRCASLVRVLLDFSRKSPAPRQRVAAAPLVRRTTDTVRDQAASRGVRLVLEETDGRCPEVYVNVTEIESAIINLVNNALDAAAEVRGTVTVGIGPASHEGTPGVRITVRDTGEGIPAEVQGKVFEPFFTTKPVGKGTGLGLSLTRQIIESHGGRIAFDTTPGAGTTFLVWLPGVRGADVQ
ncbi:MAG: PAS domain S-box protein [Deltaproteobacteria bacterium]|nr:PAS domain S-box protein [Deltaproteobacteria bacterium]